MIRHVIDIVGGEQSNRTPQTVTGEVRINIGLGNRQQEEQILAMYRKVDEDVYTLLTGQQSPKESS